MRAGVGVGVGARVRVGGAGVGAGAGVGVGGRGRVRVRGRGVPGGPNLACRCLINTCRCFFCLHAGVSFGCRCLFFLGLASGVSLLCWAAFKHFRIVAG